MMQTINDDVLHQSVNLTRLWLQCQKPKDYFGNLSLKQEEFSEIFEEEILIKIQLRTNRFMVNIKVISKKY